MSAFRVTERSISTNVMTGLQTNIARLADLQNKLSSGKEVSRASDAPGGAVMAMQYRSDIANYKQFSRNAADGLGWLSVADNALTSSMDQISRAQELVLSGLSSGSGGSTQSREAIALEIDNIRESLLGLANSTYLDRPVFGGTTPKDFAFNPDGTYAGNAGKVERQGSANSAVRVDTKATDVFGSGTQQIFTVLAQVATDLRTNPTGLTGDLAALNTSSNLLQSGLSSVGARFNQLQSLQQNAESAVVDLTSQVSDVEDIDLPKTITELTLQQTAYQAALAATARIVQPSLVDFLR